VAETQGFAQRELERLLRLAREPDAPASVTAPAPTTAFLLLGLLADEESPAARLIGVTHAAAEEHITAAE
jgi:hypothetical protein